MVPVDQCRAPLDRSRRLPPTADGPTGGRDGRADAKTPATVKGAGTIRAAERPTASIAEVTAAAATVPERWQVAILLAAWCQLRRGEVLGLQRQHIDLLHGTVTIEHALTTEGIGAPKTDAGRRTLSIPPNVLPALERHLERFTGPEVDAWLFLQSQRHSADATGA
jgi:integrase